MRIALLVMALYSSTSFRFKAYVYISRLFLARSFSFYLFRVQQFSIYTVHLFVVVYIQRLSMILFVRALWVPFGALVRPFRIIGVTVWDKVASFWTPHGSQSVPEGVQKRQFDHVP